MAISTFFIVTCIIVTASAAPQPRFDIQNVTFYSVFDGKVITSTDYLEDPGPYDVYGTMAQTDEKLPEQRWRVEMYDGSTTISVSPNGGQFWNTFSTYKPCPDCFAAGENWNVTVVRGQNSFLDLSKQFLNTTAILKSTWTDLCLTNPGDDYLVKGPCNETDPRQFWNIVWVQ